jgi:hypothetical protein
VSELHDLAGLNAPVRRVPLPSRHLQHFDTPEGTFPGHDRNTTQCRPLDARHSSSPLVPAGTRRGAAVAPLLPLLADAHLRTFNASLPFWDSHAAPEEGDCTHW